VGVASQLIRNTVSGVVRNLAAGGGANPIRDRCEFGRSFEASKVGARQLAGSRSRHSNRACRRRPRRFGAAYSGNVWQRNKANAKSQRFTFRGRFGA